MDQDYFTLFNLAPKRSDDESKLLIPMAWDLMNNLNSAINF
jgi:hypothetical protein